MDYKILKRIGKKAAIAAGLIGLTGLIAAGCKPIISYEITGTVAEETRGEGWYQVSVAEYIVNGDETQVPHKTPINIRFFSDKFDLDLTDSKISPGAKLTIEAVLEDSEKNLDYIKAYSIEKIE